MIGIGNTDRFISILVLTFRRSDGATYERECSIIQTFKQIGLLGIRYLVFI